MINLLALVVVGAVFAFATAFGNGGNDTANAMATSVASGALTYRQAVISAGILNLIGAITVGSNVAETIKASIISPKLFAGTPVVFAMAMLSALVGAAAFLLVATIFSLPVSGTHSIVGAVLGVGLLTFGGASVNTMSLLKICISWVSSPIMGGVVAGLIFLVIQHGILKRSNPLDRTLKAMPFIVFITAFSMVCFLMFESIEKSFPHVFPVWSVFVLAVGLGVIGGLIMQFAVIPRFRRQLAAEDAAGAKDVEAAGQRWSAGGDVIGLPQVDVPHRRHSHSQASAPTIAVHTATGDGDDSASDSDEPVTDGTVPPTPRVHHEKTALVEPKPKAEPVAEPPTWPLAEKVRRWLVEAAKEHAPRCGKDAIDGFDEARAVHLPPEERAFKIVQVMSACFIAFAHGSNDVANAAGPFAAIWDVYEGRTPGKSVGLPIWILIMSGVGLGTGPAMLGYRVMLTLGTKITSVSPARGFVAELAAAITLLVASHIGLPISSTHTIVGAIIGIGVASREKVEWRILSQIFASWIITIPFAMAFSVATMAIMRAVYDS
eukprot:TRINITY_DN10788_c0_g1_i1.p1 TRINITY_DN10788_c0_g1~~TRINITY_DN10788_c0_g1_i1.p1  ORF type:complete len:549 (-),score=206.33 TRINITY_DN10788_c0_g1_i1:131-1777(-)